MKTEPTQLEKIKDAVEDLQLALVENIEASKAETDVKLRKEKARFTLLKAKERLSALEKDLM